MACGSQRNIALDAALLIVDEAMRISYHGGRNVADEISSWGQYVRFLGAIEMIGTRLQNEPMLDRMQDLYSVNGNGSLLRPDGITLCDWCVVETQRWEGDTLLQKIFTMVKSDDSLADPVWDVIGKVHSWFSMLILGFISFFTFFVWRFPVWSRYMYVHSFKVVLCADQQHLESSTVY